MKHGILLLCVVSLVLAACAGSMTVRTELVRNGHRIVSGDEDIIVKGEVRKFRVSIEAVPLYWDVAGEVGIALQIDRPEAGSPSLLGIYSGRNVERTFVTPGAKIVSGVLVKSLADVMKAMSADPDLIDALKRGQAGRDAKGP